MTENKKGFLTRILTRTEPAKATKAPKAKAVRDKLPSRKPPRIILSAEQQSALAQLKRAANPNLPPEKRWPEIFFRDNKHGFLRWRTEPNRTLTNEEAIEIIGKKTPGITKVIVDAPKK